VDIIDPCLAVPPHHSSHSRPLNFPLLSPSPFPLLPQPPLRSQSYWEYRVCRLCSVPAMRPAKQRFNVAERWFTVWDVNTSVLYELFYLASTSYTWIWLFSCLLVYSIPSVSRQTWHLVITFCPSGNTPTVRMEDSLWERWDKGKGTIKWLLTVIWASAATVWCLVYWPEEFTRSTIVDLIPVCDMYTIGVYGAGNIKLQVRRSFLSQQPPHI